MCVEYIFLMLESYDPIYSMCQDKSVIIRENVSDANLHRYNTAYLYPKSNGYGDYDVASFKERELFHIY